MIASRLIPLVFAVAALSSPTFAATPDEHAGHHPVGPATSPAPKAQTAKPSAEMKWMDAQTDAMKAMHERMMAAKTPEERSALMSEHMKTMGAGMAMMKDMPKEMGDMKDAKGMAECHAMMEKHMAMMGAAMEMMSDRLPQPAK